MKCPRCNAASSVLSTRESPGSLRRRRLCFNSHRFTTYEVLDESHTLLRKLLAIFKPKRK